MSTQTNLDDHIPTPEPDTTPEVPLYDTHYAALNNDTNDFPDNAWYVSVVRNEHCVHRMRQFTDRVLSAIAPPPALTAELESKRKAIKLKDVLEPTQAYSQAWETVQFKSRYKTYLECHTINTDHQCQCQIESDQTTDAPEQFRLLCDILNERPVVLIDLTSPNQPAPREVLKDFIFSHYPV